MRADELMARLAALGLDIERATGIQGTTAPEWTAEDAAHACAGLPRHLDHAFRYRYAGDLSVYGVLRGYLMTAITDLAREERWSGEQLHCDGFTWQALATLEDPEASPRGVDERLMVRDPKTRKWAVHELPWCSWWDTVVYAPSTVAVLPRLADLAMLEEYLATCFPRALAPLRAAEAWPDVVGIAAGPWRRTGARQYEAVRSIFEEWCGTAYSHVARRIREEHDCDAA
jgi:hypothetical protein